MEHSSNSKKHVSNTVATGALALVFFSICMGQLGRIPLPGQGGGLLVSDIATCIVLLTSIRFFPRGVGVVAITPFLLWALSSLLVSPLSLGDLAIAGAYLLRLAAILALVPVCMRLFEMPPIRERVIRMFCTAYVVLIILGYVQFFFLPSLAGIGGGWDPHSYRMVATWLDPNFFGGFLVCALPFVVLYTRSFRPLLLGGAIGAILLTFSRSTFFALVIAGMACSFLFVTAQRIAPEWKRVVRMGCVLIATGICIALALLGPRAWEVFRNDPTALVRLQAYRQVWKSLGEQNIVLGVGYNAYQFAAKEVGLIQDFSTHSRAGADSSILTLLVTTGVVGVALALAPISLVAGHHLHRWYMHKNISSLVFLWATIALLVHSQIVNSFLYPHILIPYLMLLVLTL